MRDRAFFITTFYPKYLRDKAVVFDYTTFNSLLRDQLQILCMVARDIRSFQFSLARSDAGTRGGLGLKSQSGVLGARGGCLHGEPNSSVVQAQKGRDRGYEGSGCLGERGIRYGGATGFPFVQPCPTSGSGGD